VEKEMVHTNNEYEVEKGELKIRKFKNNSSLLYVKWLIFHVDAFQLMLKILVHCI